MKKQDIFFIIGVIIFFLPFFVIDEVYNFYNTFNAEHGMIMSFIKFAILATLGESIGLRIKNGVYNQKGFGLIPRAIVWGFLGLWIKLAFVVFASGTPVFLTYMGMENAIPALKGDLSWAKVFVAFCISTAMNTTFAPVFMTLHKITDTHIMNNGGTIGGLLKPIKFGEIFPSLNWKVQWGFVFKKTIPFFWIPAHTITFCLPESMQILFAALLGIVLGVLLSIAAIMGNKK
ncbi:MAG: hypothetical protein PHE56_05355 [Bacteroidales bacterium]|jgi:hypothetical protein|nr:hypothetical protein [Bacteroidales bacterium]